MLGDSAVKLLEVFEALIDCCPDEQLDNLIQIYYRDRID